jgi:hypothetical protein
MYPFYSSLITTHESTRTASARIFGALGWRGAVVFDLQQLTAPQG